MALIQKTDLDNAKIDADKLAEFVNGGASPGTLTTRTGQTLKTLARIQNDVLAAAAVPIWAQLELNNPPQVLASSGGVTAERLTTGVYVIRHASFTSNTKVMLTPREMTIDANGFRYYYQYGAGAGFISIGVRASATGNLFDPGQYSYLNLMTFPQML